MAASVKILTAIEHETLTLEYDDLFNNGALELYSDTAKLGSVLIKGFRWSANSDSFS